jgi:hypothetical protein
MSSLRAVRHVRRSRRMRIACWGSCCAMGMSSLACISTDIDVIPPLPLCRATLAASGGSTAVVQLLTHREGSEMWCSGVAIAPTLVLTVLGCVAEASDPLQADPVERVEPTAEPASDVDHAAVADYGAICDGDDGWALREHGNFEGRLGDLVAPALIEVFRLTSDFDPFDPNTYSVVKAAEVFTSRSASRCRDDIAILRLEEPLAIQPVTLSLGGGRVGDRVTLSNFCTDQEGLPAVEATASQVLAITRDAAQRTLPPRSLLLAGELAIDAPGGAVLTAGSNSMIGMIVSGTKDNCATQTTEGSTFATHLISYQRMLFDAATAADEILRLDPDADDASLQNVNECSDP